MIELMMQPLQAPMPWAKFADEGHRLAIALDGYVVGGPRFDAGLCVANFNHHEDVDRLATRATCAQVLMAVRQGLFRTFRKGGTPHATVFANDCDEDVCTAWYILRHHAVCEPSMNPLLNRLVMMEDSLDATAGAYPFPADLPALRELAWVFEPYRQFRSSGQLAKRDARSFRGVVEDVEGRIARHVSGHGQEIPLDTRYDRIGGGKGWTMVREVGAQARTGMFADGIRAYVAVRELGDGRWTYTIGRLSTFVPFDCRRIFAVCEAEEHPGRGAGDVWGGSEMVGGSPRVGASRIPPSRMQEIVDGAA